MINDYAVAWCGLGESLILIVVKTPKATKSRKHPASDLDSDTGDSAPDAKKTKLTAE